MSHPKQRPQVFVETRPSGDGCYVKARIEGAPDRLAREFAGAFGSRDEAVREATRWALVWMRVLLGGQQAMPSGSSRSR
jgi:hypothetical protein